MNKKPSTAQNEFVRILSGIPEFHSRIDSVAHRIHPGLTVQFSDHVQKLEALLFRQHLSAYFLEHEQEQIKQVLAKLGSLNERIDTFREFKPKPKAHSALSEHRADSTELEKEVY